MTDPTRTPTARPAGIQALARWVRSAEGRIVGVAIWAMYLLPPGIGTLARVAHEVEHGVQTQIEATRPGSRPDLYHTHDGSTHAHGPGVTALAAAADEMAASEDSGDEAVETVPPVLLLGLRTSGPIRLRIPVPPRAWRAATVEAAHTAPGIPPPLPPPRA